MSDAHATSWGDEHPQRFDVVARVRTKTKDIHGEVRFPESQADKLAENGSSAGQRVKDRFMLLEDTRFFKGRPRCDVARGN